MSTKQLEHALNEMDIEQEKLESDVEKARREHSRLLQNVEQLKEQIDIYKEHTKALKEAPMCLLKEYRETKTFESLAIDQLKSDRAKLVTVEEFIKQSLKNLKSIQGRINSIQGELDSMGRLYRFPDRDNRGSTTED